MLFCFVLSASAGVAAAEPAQSAAGASASVATAQQAPAQHVSSQIENYKLGADDKVRIIVYNEPNLTGEYLVNSAGMISFPLIGDVQALDRSTEEVRKEIEDKLANGYLRAPQVSIDVLTYRPFFILGEVNKPGDYPYSNGLTVLRAVATANGFTYRADKNHVYIKHPGEVKEVRFDIRRDDIPVKPGDTLRIGERYF
jgi:protein involved in polysaccharide export with SLBB domain